LTKPFAPAALVFDMDGLLLDTERIALELFETVCRAYGCEVERDVYFRCIGSTEAGTRQILCDAMGSAFPYDAISQEWFARYHERVSTDAVPVKAGAVELLERSGELALPVALATSTRTQLARHKLRLAGLDDYFDVVIGGDAVSRGKPDPEPYLTASRALGQAPRACWAIEDSDNGVRSAHAAGLFVIQVPDLVAPSPALRALGHPVVADLHAVARLLAEHCDAA
jgi:HAD superfamily hydrolase (TIGR01509 family)